MVICAGQRLNFKSGFQVHNGANFHAYIQPFSNDCPNILRYSHPQQQTPLAQQAPEPEKDIEWNEKNSDNQGLKIYPNPSTGDVVLEITQFEGDGCYMLYDLTGRMLQTGLITGSQTSITMQHKGVLIVKVTQGTLVQRQRLIVH